MPNLGRPSQRREVPPPPPLGDHVPSPQNAKPARKTMRFGVGDASPRPNPPCPRKTGIGPRPHAPRTGRRERASARPRTPLTEAQGTPILAPLARPHSAQRPRKCVRCWVGDGSPHRHPSALHGKRAVGPGRLPRGWAAWGGRLPNPGNPSQRQESPPPGDLVPPPTACSKDRR